MPKIKDIKKNKQANTTNSRIKSTKPIIEKQSIFTEEELIEKEIEEIRTKIGNILGKEKVKDICDTLIEDLRKIRRARKIIRVYEEYGEEINKKLVLPMFKEKNAVSEILDAGILEEEMNLNLNENRIKFSNKYLLVMNKRTAVKEAKKTMIKGFENLIIDLARLTSANKLIGERLGKIIFKKLIGLDYFQTNIEKTSGGILIKTLNEYIYPSLVDFEKKMQKKIDMKTAIEKERTEQILKKLKTKYANSDQEKIKWIRRENEMKLEKIQIKTQISKEEIVEFLKTLDKKKIDEIRQRTYEERLEKIKEPLGTIIKEIMKKDRVETNKLMASIKKEVKKIKKHNKEMRQLLDKLLTETIFLYETHSYEKAKIFNEVQSLYYAIKRRDYERAETKIEISSEIVEMNQPVLEKILGKTEYLALKDTLKEMRKEQNEKRIVELLTSKENAKNASKTIKEVVDTHENKVKLRSQEPVLFNHIKTMIYEELINAKINGEDLNDKQVIEQVEEKIDNLLFEKTRLPAPSEKVGKIIGKGFEKLRIMKKSVELMKMKKELMYSIDKSNIMLPRNTVETILRQKEIGAKKQMEKILYTLKNAKTEKEIQVLVKQTRAIAKSYFGKAEIAEQKFRETTREKKKLLAIRRIASHNDVGYRKNIQAVWMSSKYLFMDTFETKQTMRRFLLPFGSAFNDLIGNLYLSNYKREAKGSTDNLYLERTIDSLKKISAILTASLATKIKGPILLDNVVMLSFAYWAIQKIRMYLVETYRSERRNYREGAPWIKEKIGKVLLEKTENLGNSIKNVINKLAKKIKNGIVYLKPYLVPISYITILGLFSHGPFVIKGLFQAIAHGTLKVNSHLIKTLFFNKINGIEQWVGLGLMASSLYILTTFIIPKIYRKGIRIKEDVLLSGFDDRVAFLVIYHKALKKFFKEKQVKKEQEQDEAKFLGFLRTAFSHIKENGGLDFLVSHDSIRDPLTDEEVVYLLNQVYELYYGTKKEKKQKYYEQINKLKYYRNWVSYSLGRTISKISYFLTPAILIYTPYFLNMRVSDPVVSYGTTVVASAFGWSWLKTLKKSKTIYMPEKIMKIREVIEKIGPSFVYALFVYAYGSALYSRIFSLHKFTSYYMFPKYPPRFTVAAFIPLFLYHVYLYFGYKRKKQIQELSEIESIKQINRSIDEDPNEENQGTEINLQPLANNVESNLGINESNNIENFEKHKTESNLVQILSKITNVPIPQLDDYETKLKYLVFGPKNRQKIHEIYEQIQNAVYRGNEEQIKYIIKANKINEEKAQMLMYHILEMEKMRWENE